MKAVRVFGKNDIRLVEADLPKPGFGQVLVRVKRCGICGTDYSILNGAFRDMLTFPMTLGHEWSGEVVCVGDGAVGFSLGDRVAGDTCVSCGICYECLNGHYIHCKNRRCVGTVNTWDGAYAEYILFPARHLFRLPDSVDYDNGALLEPAATAMLGVVQAQVGLGDNVVVHGTGPIGIAAALIARLAGAAKTVITGRKEFKLRLAKRMGVDYAVNTTEQDAIEAVRGFLGDEGANAIIEASGSAQLMKASLNMAANRARIAVASFFEKEVALNLDGAVFKDISIMSVAGNIGMSVPTLRLMAAGRLDMRPLITSRCTLDEVPETLAHLKDDNEKKIKIMIDYEL